MRIRTANRTVQDSAGNTVTGNSNTAGTVRCSKCHNLASTIVTPRGQNVVQCPTCKSQYLLTKM